MVNIIDKINRHGEITEPKEFTLPDSPFFLCVVPKAVDDLEMPIMSAKLIKEKEYSDCPFPANCWSPMLVDRLNVIQDYLDKYRLFWGTTD